MHRYAILSPETFPRWQGSSKDGVSHLLGNQLSMEPGQWQLGRSKVFIKSPESLFMLEELRERKYDGFARIIQRAYRRYRSRKFYLECKKQCKCVAYIITITL